MDWKEFLIQMEQWLQQFDVDALSTAVKDAKQTILDAIEDDRITLVEAIDISIKLMNVIAVLYTRTTTEADGKWLKVIEEIVQILMIVLPLILRKTAQQAK